MFLASTLRIRCKKYEIVFSWPIIYIIVVLLAKVRGRCLLRKCLYSRQIGVVCELLFGLARILLYYCLSCIVSSAVQFSS
jgi:hypothetical protein